jgi:hypothetical protein
MEGKTHYAVAVLKGDAGTLGVVKFTQEEGK